LDEVYGRFAVTGRSSLSAVRFARKVKNACVPCGRIILVLDVVIGYDVLIPGCCSKHTTNNQRVKFFSDSTSD
jgi:hypothetical protein